MAPPPAALDIAAPALKFPAGTTYEDWLSTGRTLSSAKRHLDWLVGDWLTHGRKHFPEQIELALETLDIEPRHLKRIEKTVEAFPPHLRDKRLSFDHHAHVADLPTEEALPLLKEARKERLPASKLRQRVMEFKLDSGRILVRDEEDAYDRQITALVVEWNRSMQSVRDDFAELIREANYRLIEL